MYICPNCNTKTEEKVNFCFKCGTQMVYAEPQPVEPQPTAQVQQPVYEAYQPVKKPHLALKIVAMALSIGGIVMAAIGNLYTLIGLIEPEGYLAFSFALVFGLFFSPFSIVGLCLSNKCIDAGDTSAMSRVGKILGIIGIIVAGVSLFIGIASLGMY